MEFLTEQARVQLPVSIIMQRLKYLELVIHQHHHHHTHFKLKNKEELMITCIIFITHDKLKRCLFEQALNLIEIPWFSGCKIMHTLLIDATITKNPQKSKVQEGLS
jgi:hypothetical protein